MDERIEWPEDRAAYLAEGLRALADHVEAHPEMAEDWPFSTSYRLVYSSLTLMDYASSLQEAVTTRRRWGLADKFANDNQFGFERRFGPLTLAVAVSREAACEQVEVGVEEYEVEEIPDEAAETAAELQAQLDALKVTVTKERPVTEWICPDSFLEKAADQIED